jgi:hypothetical protein
MATEPITVHVDSEAARVFKTASPDKRRKVEALLSLQLRHHRVGDQRQHYYLGGA